MNKRSPVLLIMIFMLLAGCTSWNKGMSGTLSVVSPDFFGIGEEAALQLMENMRKTVGDNGKVIMTALVNIDDLYETSRFGRTLTESIATSLFKHGLGVVEIRKASDVFIKNKQGEFVLSRNASLLALEHDVEAIVSGTYSLTPNSVIINIRMLDAGSQEVLSVAGLEVQRSNNINNLLAASTGRGNANNMAGVTDVELSGYER